MLIHYTELIVILYDLCIISPNINKYNVRFASKSYNIAIMTEAKGINALSMESINIDELMQQPEQGRIMMNDEFVLVIGGHLQDTRFLEEGKIYQMVEPRLIFAMKGHADLCVNLQDCHIEQGSVMLLPTDTIVEIKEISADARVVAIMFRDGIDVMDEIILNTSPTESDHLLRMIYLTWDIMQIKPYRAKTVQNLLQAIVSDVQYIQNIEAESIKYKSTSRTQDLFMQFKRQVHRHCTRERSIPFYAGQLHVTPHHLSAIVKKASGKSVMHWVNRATIQEAKVLLKTDHAMGYEIAGRLHFPNASAFSKFFKRETGMTPREYQEKTKQ